MSRDILEKTMINENLTFGIDLGIASCGWAVLQKNTAENGAKSEETSGEVVAAGSWIFDAPEEDKTRTPSNQIRRASRLMRRVIHRRRIRMRDIRNLLYTNGLLPTNKLDALKYPEIDPWEQRARGLDHSLTPEEFAVALGHIAKHRGFKSSAKRQETNAASDDKKMLKAMEQTREKLARYRTVGEMFARDETYSGRRRNRDGVFDRSVSRDDLCREVKELFAAQRRFHQTFATTDLEQQFNAIAFFQRPLQDSVNLVGQCPFEPDEKRCAKYSPSYERFRLLTRLINLRIVNGGEVRKLTAEEIAKLGNEAGKTKKLSFKKLRSLLDLLDEESFDGVPAENEQNDVVARTGEAMVATATFRKLLGETSWRNLHNNFAPLDAISFIVSFYETDEKIKEKITELNLPDELYDRVISGLEAGEFSKFKGAGHLSAKACRNLLPFLEQGHRYDEACQLAGYNHADTEWSNREQITTKKQLIALKNEISDFIANPVVRKSFGEAMKQLWAMKNRFGLPHAIHIELARDLGKSAEERREIEKGIKQKTTDREKDKAAIKELLNLQDVDGTTLLRYQLWKEQCGRCLYSGKPIAATQLIKTDNSVQVDHILPWSRFGDDSFHNKTLCLTTENQKKKGRTPFEWFQQDQPDQWDIFVTRVTTNPNLHRRKIFNLKLVNAKEKEESFRSRNLNDTRYACRIFAEAAKLFYPKGERQEKFGKRRIFTRPGALTSSLRRSWGLETLKKINGKRINDDRHHAIDAIVLAAIGEGEVQRLTRWYQQKELNNERMRIDPPWENFRNDVLDIYENIAVARPERRRSRGSGHDATIKQLEISDNQKFFYERKAIKDLTEADLKKIKDSERNYKLVEILEDWLKRGQPLDDLPRSPKGDIITKVRLTSNDKPGVDVRGGRAGRGKLVRIDIFSKPNKNGDKEWYAVPIYNHQIANKKQYPFPPNQYAMQGKDEAEWPLIDNSFHFEFSLYSNSYVQTLDKTGVIIEGYYNSFDRTVARINVEMVDGSEKTRIGIKTLKEFSKYSVDRFGQLSKVENEKRIWHGAASTSPNQPS